MLYFASSIQIQGIKMNIYNIYDAVLQKFDDGKTLLVTPNGVLKNMKSARIYRGTRISYSHDAAMYFCNFQQSANKTLQKNMYGNIQILALQVGTSITPCGALNSSAQISVKHGKSAYGRIICCMNPESSIEPIVFAGASWAAVGFYDSDRASATYCALHCAYDAWADRKFRERLLGEFTKRNKGGVIGPEHIVKNVFVGWEK